MQTIPVDVRRVDRAAPDLETDLERARILSNWMDSKFSILGVRVGMDSIVGLIPVVGDTLTALAASYPIYLAERHGLGRAVQARMGVNVLVDWAVGSVPILGDVFDVAYKANLKNFKLLEAAAGKKREREARARQRGV